MKPKCDPEIDPDNPPLTEEFLKGMRPAREVHGQAWVDARMKGRRGRPRLDSTQRKVSITMRISPDVLEHFKAGGKGWQTRMEEALRKEAGLV